MGLACWERLKGTPLVSRPEIMHVQVNPKDALRDLTTKKDADGALRFITQLDTQIKGPTVTGGPIRRFLFALSLGNHSGGHLLTAEVSARTAELCRGKQKFSDDRWQIAVVPQPSAAV